LLLPSARDTLITYDDRWGPNSSLAGYHVDDDARDVVWRTAVVHQFDESVYHLLRGNRGIEDLAQLLFSDHVVKPI
jgi:hypothetical protein